MFPIIELISTSTSAGQVYPNYSTPCMHIQVKGKNYFVFYFTFCGLAQNVYWCAFQVNLVELLQIAYLNLTTKFLRNRNKLVFEGEGFTCFR